MMNETTQLMTQPPAIAQITLSSVKHCLLLSEVNCLLLHNSHVKVLLCVTVLQERSVPFLHHLQLLSIFLWGWHASHLYGTRFPTSSLWYFLQSVVFTLNFPVSLLFITGMSWVLETRLAFYIADEFLLFAILIFVAGLLVPINHRYWDSTIFMYFFNSMCK
jgi:hypothetical protein